MSENTVFLLLTALIHNLYKTIISKLDTKAFGLKETSRIKAFVFRDVYKRQVYGKRKNDNPSL